MMYDAHLGSATWHQPAVGPAYPWCSYNHIEEVRTPRVHGPIVVGNDVEARGLEGTGYYRTWFEPAAFVPW